MGTRVRATVKRKSQKKSKRALKLSKKVTKRPRGKLVLKKRDRLSEGWRVPLTEDEMESIRSLCQTDPELKIAEMKPASLCRRWIREGLAARKQKRGVS